MANAEGGRLYFGIAEKKGADSGYPDVIDGGDRIEQFLTTSAAVTTLTGAVGIGLI